MYLSVVEISNFRSFRVMRAELQPGLNVVVGRNNTGKTNLLSAIRHALGPSAARGEALRLSRDDFFKESPNDTAERTIAITLTFAGLTDAQRSHFFEIVDFNLADLSKSTAVIRFTASWPRSKRQASIKRTGGSAAAESTEVPAKLLESLPITSLPAMRDAEASLAPGYRSRLAMLLEDLAEREGGDTRADIESIYARANDELEDRPLIKKTIISLQSTTRNLAGSDYSASAINAAEIEFDKILRSLQVQMAGSPIGSLDANGLGYNNLLYMAVVLEHLKSPEPDEHPMFLIEEPEAHLHPQLTMLLADHLATKTPGKSTPQTIVTTHSPTLAASVPPDRVIVLFEEVGTYASRCNSIKAAGMSDKEQGELQRMMDITRATLYFAKAAILVEGMSEALLVPVLASRLGHSLAGLQISVIPICGVAFETFKKILDPTVHGIPTAIVTDGDPPVPTNLAWEIAAPEREGDSFAVSSRTAKLVTLFAGHKTVRVFNSQVTLEYDLAEAGYGNATIMAKVWEQCFLGVPGTFNEALLAEAGDGPVERAMATWRGICRAKHSGSKAEFAHRLATYLGTKNAAQNYVDEFAVPNYLKAAIEFVVSAVKPIGLLNGLNA